MKLRPHPTAKAYKPVRKDRLNPAFRTYAVKFNGGDQQYEDQADKEPNNGRDDK